MNQRSGRQYQLPSGLVTRLRELTRRTRRQKVLEAVGVAAAVMSLAFLMTFGLERLGDTPAAVRGALFALAIGAVVAVGAALVWRWFWQLRRPEQVARLIGRTFPSLGDQVLGVIELADGRTGYAAGRLIEAALAQADERAAQFDFQQARPRPRSRRGWIGCLVFPLLTAALAIAVPDAALNTLQRWALAWQPIPRYTFTRIADLPDEVVVPYAEPMELQVSLAKDSQWAPKRARAKYVRRRMTAEMAAAGRYEFAIEKPTETGTVRIAVGDARERVGVRPMHRPELEQVEAEIRLPDYLRRTEPLKRDLRTGRLSVVVGSRVAVRARANRGLRTASAQGADVGVQRNEIRSKPIAVEDSHHVVLSWKDIHGLEGKQAFEIDIEPREDEPPVISWSGLHSGQVVLWDEPVTFDIVAQDDFGVRQVAMEWQAIGDPDSDVHSEPPGRRIVAFGDPDADELSTVGTFCAKELDVEPGVVWLRVSASDYCPDHDPSFSAVISLQVMTADQHAIWLNQQLRKWFARAEEVYKREQALHDVNRRLRSLPAEQLDRPETRQEIERQAAAEQANAARLSSVTRTGRELLKEAGKNKEIGVGHLETLAENLLKLEELAEKRMPSVAELLRKASTAEPGKPENRAQAPNASQSEETPRGIDSPDSAPQAGKQNDSKKKGLPSVNTSDKSYFEQEKDAAGTSPSSKSGGRIGLPQNILQGGPEKKSNQAGTCPAGQQLDEAVEEQRDLLEQFAQIRDALQKLLINMEGSTFVKRLKAASKRQFEVAADLEQFAVSSFGATDEEQQDGDDAVSAQQEGTFLRLAAREQAESKSMRQLQSDLAAYYDRVQMAKIRPVLDEMEEAEAPRELMGLARELKKLRSGDVLAEAEFWGETFDRWAEMLVDVASGGT